MGRLRLEILDLAGQPVVLTKVARAYFEASSGGGLFGGGVAPMPALSEAAVEAGINPADLAAVSEDAGASGPRPRARAGRRGSP